MPVPFMPTELLEIIVTETALDYLKWKGGMQHVSTIALVSHRFRILANRKRFKDCKIYAVFDEFEDDNRYFRLLEFKQIITSSLWSVEERVSQYVERLHVTFGSYPDVLGGTGFYLKIIFNSIFHNSDLQNCSLYLTGDGYDFDFSQISTCELDLAMVLRRVCLHPNLSLLHLSGMENVPPSLCWSPYISELILDSISFGHDIGMFREAFFGKLTPDMNSRVPFRNLQSLPFNNVVNLLHAWSEQNPPPRLTNVTISCFGKFPQDMREVLYHLGGAITTLTLNLDLDLIYLWENNPLVGRCLTMLKSLTIYTLKSCFSSRQGDIPMFNFLVPLLPTNPSQNLNIDIHSTVECNDYVESIQTTLLKFYKGIGEPELVRYWQNIERRSSQVEATGPFLNVTMVVNLFHCYTGNHQAEDAAFFISLFDRLRSTRAVSLSVTVT